MDEKIIGNYLRVHRKKYRLTQQELARLVGYVNKQQVMSHERSKSVPPLLIALAYEAVFRVPVSAIFVGFDEAASHAGRANLAEFKEELERRLHGRRSPKLLRQKLEWVQERLAATEF